MAKTKKPTAVPGIAQFKDNNALYQVALLTVLNFIDRIPGLISLELAPKPSWKGPDGKSHKGNFAVVNIYIKGKRATKALIDTLLLGQLATPLGSAQALDPAAVASAIEQALKNSVNSYLPQTDSSVLTGAAQGASPQKLANDQKRALAESFIAKWPWLTSNRDQINARIEQIPDLDINKELWLFWNSSPDRPQAEARRFTDASDIQGRIQRGAIKGEIPQLKNYQGKALEQLITDFGELFPAIKSLGSGTSGLPALQGVFSEGEPYKYTTGSTVYIFQGGKLRGVVSGFAFAKFYSKIWDGKTDLNTIHKINPMPDLTKYQVPLDLFSGALIL